MISPTIKLTDIKLRTAAVRAAVMAASIEPEAKAALLVERAAKQSMKSGGRYQASRGKRKGRIARAGKPSPVGDPPNVQRGILRASITSARAGMSWIVGPTERYGATHEFGGRHHPRRPFMLPALLAVMRKFPKLWRNLNLRRHDRGPNS